MWLVAHSPSLATLTQLFGMVTRQSAEVEVSAPHAVRLLRKNGSQLGILLCRIT